MRGFNLAGTRLLTLFLLATGAGVAGCSSIDQAVGGGGTPPRVSATAQAAPPEAATPPPAAPAPEAGVPAAAPTAPVATTTMTPPAAGMAPIVIQPGADTGTAVGRTVTGLRSQLQSLVTKVSSDAQHLADLKSGSAQAIGAYQQATAAIQTRLAVGTAPGNPELIGQWNTAQAALDTITGNINALSKLAGDIGGDSSAAHNVYNSIQATYNTGGGVDEDQRQLNALSDEASQTTIVADRLLRDAKQSIERQTAFVANERGSLTMLASAIKAGDYAGSLTAGAPAIPAAMPAETAEATPPPAGTPIVTIKFDRAHVDYEKTLYSALSQALASQPKASFSVVGIARSTTRLAANSAERDAKAVMRTMGEMGVPPTRMEVSGATDPALNASEVRVYVK